VACLPGRPRTRSTKSAALPTAFAGITDLGELADAGRDQLHANIRAAWGGKAPSTFNAKRAAVGSALAYFHEQDWIGDPTAVLAGLDREHQPKPTDNRVRTREQIDRLITDKRQSLEDRTLWSMLYSTAARADEVLRLDVEDLDRANRRARTIRKGGKEDDLLYDIRTARMLGQLLGRRRTGPVFLSTRRAPEDGTARSGGCCCIASTQGMLERRLPPGIRWSRPVRRTRRPVAGSPALQRPARSVRAERSAPTHARR
jgi:integrase/recombinase XerC